MAKHVVTAVTELPPGSRRLFNVKGRPIVVFNLSGEFFALINNCPHQGGSLCDGAIAGLVESTEPGIYNYSRRGEILKCPWHGWEFDIRTGQSWCEPSKVRARRFDTEVQSGATLIKGPYVAETIPVAVENDYVVVEV